MIKVKNLTRKYGTYTAVESVSFEIKQGEIVGLLGHNGAGKTTTLKMLTGYLEPTSGDIEVAGLDITDHCLEVQSKIGYLSEASPLYPEMTVWQYLEYVAKLRDIPEGQRVAAIRKAITATDLGEKATSYISTLSKGYRQRVGVAQAIIHEPAILILDEPTNGLDPTQIFAMRQLIKDLSKTTTVIISTHVMQEVEAICDRVLIILRGQLVVDSSLEALQKGTSITLALKKDLEPVRQALSGIPKVKSISKVSEEHGIFHYSVDADTSDRADSVTPMIARKIMESGWELYGLNQDHRTLETVFKEVNRQGGAHHV